MTIDIESEEPAVAPEIVDAFEATLPGRLPADYRAFLESRNGGVPQPNWWPPELPGEGFAVAEFLSLNAGESYRSIEETRETFTDRIPDHLLAVASATGGIQVCVSLTGDGPGSVWMYDAESETAEDDGEDPHLLIRLAESFTVFVELLEPAPTWEEMVRRLSAVDPGFRATDLM